MLSSDLTQLFEKDIKGGGHNCNCLIVSRNLGAISAWSQDPVKLETGRDVDSISESGVKMLLHN